MRSVFPVVAAILAASIFAPSNFAVAGELDTSFGDNGISVVKPPPGYAGEQALAITVDSRQRLIIAGSNRKEKVLVRRYQPSGSPDNSFGDNGLVETSFGGSSEANAVTLLRNGDILVAGGTETGLALVRYRPDGRRALGFGRRGRVVTGAGIKGAGVLALDARSGRIFSAGYGINHYENWTGLVVAYRGDGSIDNSFAREGRAELTSLPETEVVLVGVETLPDGKVLVGGNVGGRLVLGRLLADGRPDRSFGGGDGIVMVDADGDRLCPCSYANAMTIAPGGRPVLAGVATGRSGGVSSLLARFTPEGRLDRDFGRRGVVRTRRGAHLALSGVSAGADGRITGVGLFQPRGSGKSEVAVLRYLPSGELDPRFGRRGFYHRRVGLGSVGAAVITKPDGSVVVAGSARFPALRFPENDDPLVGSRTLLMKFRP